MDNYFAHQELIKRFKLNARQINDFRIFDRHVGLFYAKRINKGIIDYVPVKINHEGMSDCYGLLKTRNGLIHYELEFKTASAKQTNAQKNWESFISSMNGDYLLVRENIDEAFEKIHRDIVERGYR